MNALIDTGKVKGEPTASILGFDHALMFLNSFKADRGLILTSGDTLGAAPGGVPELVVLTPCGGFASPASVLLIGLLGGVVCHFGCQLERVLKYDDSLDAFGVHGVGGMLGAIFVGEFAIRPVGLDLTAIGTRSRTSQKRTVRHTPGQSLLAPRRLMVHFSPPRPQRHATAA